MSHNSIPPMTHPLSVAWDQPNTSLILVDDTHAVMTERVLLALKEYSTSTPSGVYEGKMWKRNVFGDWLLCWYDQSTTSNTCSIRIRTILILSEPAKGEKYGQCNRTACSNDNAIYYNHSTRKYYCRSCAAKINLANLVDAQRMYGHHLCTLDKL